MNVNNLREKFNQPNKGAISSPGTSFGVALKSTAKTSACVKNAPSNADPPPQFRSVKLRASKSPSPERVASTLNRAHLRSSKSPSLDLPHVNGVSSAKAATTNGDCGARAPVKSPEQTQQEVILRKWNRGSSTTEGPTTVDSPAALAQSKKCVTRFISQLSTSAPTTAKDAVGIDNNVAADNGLSVNGRNDSHKCAVESSVSPSKANGERQNCAPATAMNVRPANSSFLHQDVRGPAKGADLGSTLTNGPLKPTTNSVPAPFVAQNSAPKPSPAADRWKPTPVEPPEFAAPKLNSTADRWKLAPAPQNSEPEFRRVTLTKGEFLLQFFKFSLIFARKWAPFPVLVSKIATTLSFFHFPCFAVSNSFSCFH